MRCLIWAPRRQNYKIFSHYNKYFYWLPFIDQSESGLHFLKLMPPLSQHFEVLNKMADEIVGKRILCEGFRGEIKYVGLVPPTSGTYVKNIPSDVKQLEWCWTKTIDDFFIAKVGQAENWNGKFNLKLYSGIQILLVRSICCFKNKVMLIKRRTSPNEPHFYGKKMGKKAFLCANVLFTHFQTTWWYHRNCFFQMSSYILCTCIWKDKRQFPLKHHMVWFGKIKHKS